MHAHLHASLRSYKFPHHTGILPVIRSHGRNALTPPKKPGFLVKLWLQINNVMIWILLCSAVIVVALQQWIEFGK